MQSNAILSVFGRRVRDAFNNSELMAWRTFQRALAESRRFVAALDDAFQTTMRPLERYAARAVAEHEQVNRAASSDSTVHAQQASSAPRPANDASTAGEQRSAA